MGFDVFYIYICEIKEKTTAIAVSAGHSWLTKVLRDKEVEI